MMIICLKKEMDKVNIKNQSQNINVNEIVDEIIEDKDTNVIVDEIIEDTNEINLQNVISNESIIDKKISKELDEHNLPHSD